MFVKKTWKKILGFVAVIVLVMMVLSAVRHRYGGRVRDPVLDSAQIARIDRIVMERPDGLKLLFDKKDADRKWMLDVQGMDVPVAEADYFKVLDFLYVFNFWEIAWIPDEDEERAWKDLIRKQGGSLKLKAGARNLLKFKFACQDDLFLIMLGSHCYAMTSIWKPSTWMGFFTEDPKQWKSCLLLDFSPSDIRFVDLRYAFSGTSPDTLSYRLEVAASDSSAAGEVGEMFKAPVLLLHTAAGFRFLPEDANRYLSSFSQVYFTVGGEARMGKLLYTLTIGSKKDEVVCLSVFEKQVPAVSEFFFDSGVSGDRNVLRPDLFQAVVVVSRGVQTDTVQMPFVVLDKMARTASDFAEGLPASVIGNAK